MNPLAAYLEQNGLLLCNVNPELPALEDIGATWQDVTALIDAHAVFTCKAYRGRTTYLSPEVYGLLRALKPRKPLPEAAARIYSLLEGNAADTALLKRLSGLPAKEYQRGFQFLLQNLWITAVENGSPLNDNWSSFLYGTAADWAQAACLPPLPPAPLDRLTEILSRTMTDRQIQALLR